MLLAGTYSQSASSESFHRFRSDLVRRLDLRSLTRRRRHDIAIGSLFTLSSVRGGLCSCTLEKTGSSRVGYSSVQYMQSDADHRVRGPDGLVCQIPDVQTRSDDLIPANFRSPVGRQNCTSPGENEKNDN